MRKCSRWTASGTLNGGRWRRQALAGAVLGLSSLALSPGSLAGPRDFPGETHDATLLRYREILGHVVVVPVRLNGQGPFDLALDTAATFTTLEPGLAAELGLTPLGPAATVTIAGARLSARARLERVQFGAVEVSGVEVRCAEITALRSADRRIRGILGQSALARVSFGLDHARGLVLFAPPGRTDAVVPLDEREDRPAVTLELRRSGVALSLVLDSGLSVPVLFEKLGTPLAVERVAGGFFQAETNSGSARLSMAHLEGRVGLLRIPSTLAAVQDDSAAGGRQEDGLLPTRLFRIVYFDRAGKQLLLQGR